MSEELETLSSTSAAPSWWTAMQRDYLAGMANVFILHGNVGDYVEHPTRNLTLREYLEQRLLRRHAVATFAPDQGITLAGGELVGRETKAWIDRTRGIEAPPPPAPGGFDPDAALRAASGGAYKGGSDGEPLPDDAPRALDALLRWAREGTPEDEKKQPLPGVPTRLVGRDTARRTVAARAAVIIERADLIVPPSEKDRLGPSDRALLAALHRAGQDAGINGNNALVIILAPSLEEIHPDLRLSTAGIRTIEIPVPDHDQRLSFIARILPQRKVRLGGLSEPELASQTAGLGRRHVEDLAMRAAGAGAGGLLTPEMVKARKDELIKAEYAEVLTILEPTVTFDQVGGHDAVKAYLQKRVVRLMRDPLQRHRCPMGILFAGPSGTGKTFISRAVANALGINCVEMSPDNIRGSYVGESEKKLKRAIRGIQAMAPCVLFIDEIDTKVRRSTGGGGGGGESVEAGIFGKLLEFLGDTSHRGEILLVAATNRPDAIDAALKRPGRIDAKIPMLPPETPEERADALAALAIRHDVIDLGREGWLAVGRETDSYTQAELEGLVVQAASIRVTDEDELAEAVNSRLEGRREPTEAELMQEAFELAREEVVPSTDDIKWHTDLALAVCSNRRMVPERYRARVGQQLRKAKQETQARQQAQVGAARTAIADDDAWDDEEV